MDFEIWEPVYRQILADFGYDRAGDERARDLLADLFGELTQEIGETAVERTLSALEFDGETVAVAGAAGTLPDDLETLEEAGVVVAASDAARTLQNEGYEVDCMVTDLDGSPETARELSASGVPVVVHAHGDNIGALESHVPALTGDAVVPTTQARPNRVVQNFGGFTDGDRAAFLADELGASRLVFPGWEFDDETVSAEKRQKLHWAERLLHWLEHRRDERFEILDGRRSELAVSAFE